MQDFKKLPSKEINDGIQYIFKAENGYGASIVSHSFSYGHESGLWELAVIKYYGDDWTIDYSTPITEDVLGYLSDKEVNKILGKIKELPA
ncbi:MAG TPA: hypothetical protein VIJ57_08280 [Hanamia sp.]